MKNGLIAFVGFSSLLALLGPGCGLVSSVDVSKGPDGGAIGADGSAAADAAEDGSGPFGTTDASARRDSSTVGVDSGPIGDLCTPPATVTYTKKWIAPHPHQAACAQGDIDLFRKICLGPQSDGGAACKSFMASTNGKACSACILPASGGLGPIIPDGNFVSVNVAGCIAIAQNTVADGAGCASAAQYVDECEQAACGACAQDPNSTGDMINACDSAAQSGACSAEIAAAKCEDQLLDAGGPGSSCLGGTDFDTSYALIVPIFCLN